MKDEPILTRVGYNDRQARDEDFRKTFYPIPFINLGSVTGAVIGGFASVLHNLMGNKPVLTGMHRTFGLGCAGLYAGYTLTKFSYTRKMGKFKYALDYAERHKEDFPEREFKTFSDPSWLYPWNPIR